jgi:hypothetical protein
MYSKSVFRFTKKAYVIFALALFVSMVLYEVGTENGYALVVKMSLEDLSREASSIVVGEVTDMQSQWEDGNIYTDVTISVERYIKGAGGKEVTIKVLGGTVGDITQWVSDVPDFQIGERTLIFLRNDQVVGWHQGKFAIVNHEVMVEDVFVDEADFINRIRDILGMPPLKIDRGPEVAPAAPVITSITPTTTAAGTRASSPCGPGGGISDITIKGSGFGTSKGEVLITPGKSDCIYSWSDTQIKCHIQYGAYSGDIKVKTSGGATSAAKSYVITYGAYWKSGFDHEAKWHVTNPMGENYLVNEKCPTDWLNAIKAAMNTWSTAGAKFKFSYGGSTPIKQAVYDDKNVIAWNDLPDGTLAQNAYWLSTKGDFLESDIIFNTKYTWSTTGEAKKYDIQNVGTHELGHALNLKDLYGDKDKEKTMYGYGATGETKKRTLEIDDKNGIKYIYGTTLGANLIVDEKEEIGAIPGETRLLQNLPNPFNPDTWIPYKLASDASVTISIYNLKGQLIRALHLENQKAGNYLTKDRAAYWDGKNSLGDKVASGIYFYTLQAGNFRATRKMVIVK